MEKIKVHTNQVAYVKLTDKAVKLLKEVYRKKGSEFCQTPDKDGFYHFMFWELMEVIGPIMRADNNRSPFEDAHIYFAANAVKPEDF